MKIIIAVIVLVFIVAAGVAYLLKIRSSALPELTADEALILDAAREVYGDHITDETITQSDGDAILTLALRDEKVSTIDVNLSSLARKHRDEGLTLPVIKLSLRFD